MEIQEVYDDLVAVKGNISELAVLLAKKYPQQKPIAIVTRRVPDIGLFLESITTSCQTIHFNDYKWWSEAQPGNIS